MVSSLLYKASGQISSCTSFSAAASVATLSTEPAGGADGACEGEVTMPAGTEALDAVVGLVVDGEPDANAGTSFALVCLALWAAARALLRFCWDGVLRQGWW